MHACRMRRGGDIFSSTHRRMTWKIACTMTVRPNKPKPRSMCDGSISLMDFPLFGWKGCFNLYASVIRGGISAQLRPAISGVGGLDDVRRLPIACPARQVDLGPGPDRPVAKLPMSGTAAVDWSSFDLGRKPASNVLQCPSWGKQPSHRSGLSRS